MASRRLKKDKSAIFERHLSHNRCAKKSNEKCGIGTGLDIKNK